jgi:hypothetical protein
MPQDDSTFMKILSNRQLEFDDSGNIIKKASNPDTAFAKQELRKQLGRDKSRKTRQRKSLDDIMNTTGGAFG